MSIATKTHALRAKSFVTLNDALRTPAIDMSGDTVLQSFSLLNWYNDNNIVESIDLSGCTALRLVNMEEMAALTALDVNGCSALTTLSSLDAEALVTLDASGCAALTQLATGVIDLLQTCNLSGCESLPELYLSGKSVLTTLDVTGCESIATIVLDGCHALVTLDASDCPLGALSIGDCPLLVTVDASGGVLNANAVDSVLAALVANAAEDGTVNLSGAGNEPPGVSGLADKATLEGLGWTVSVSS